ncbi:MAG: hydroxymethylglutaryl-CoA synthase family protein [Deltaproteobacteria bacterium]|nr:MAG: hydroxymethylglutaryl-CoA synthase family protein [Deltaproteobacteria bacterium]
MRARIGIHALGLAIPRRYVDMEDLARARGVEPGKYLHGLGAREMAVAEPGEDTVALAALAGRRALAASGLAPHQLGLLVVGTETGVDHSKPVASFVHGLLELPAAMRVYDTQHACYGGTAGLMAAVEWIASGAADGRAALVVCSDIARYGVGTPGEPTQGAGAVAMVVAADPGLVELDVGISGTSSTHVHDFWRPLGLREAQVDGHYSVQCYLDAVATAYRGWRRRAAVRDVIRGDGLVSERLARICYHVPFCKMARKAHLQVRRCDLDDAGAPWDVGAEEARGAAAFREQVEPSLGLCARIGNIYTGSLYLGLAGLLHAQAHGLIGARIGLFSYGSGCTSEFFSGVVAARAAEQIAAARLDEVLAARERISIAEYERILALPPTAPLVPRAGHASDDQFRFVGVADQRRQYSTR